MNKQQRKQLIDLLDRLIKVYENETVYRDTTDAQENNGAVYSYAANDNITVKGICSFLPGNDILNNKPIRLMHEIVGEKFELRVGMYVWEIYDMSGRTLRLKFLQRVRAAVIARVNNQKIINLYNSIQW